MKLSIVEKIGFGAGDMAINVVIIAMQLLLAYFYTDIYGLHAADVGVLLVVVRMIDAIIDPAMGMLTDKVSTRWGRYRPWLLWFAIPFGFAVYLMFITPDMAYTGKLAWAYFTYILMTLVYTAITIPYISLIGVITDDPGERLSANGYRFVMTKIAAFLVTIVVPMLAVWLGQGNKALGYQLSMGLMGAMGAVLFIFCFITTRERSEHELPSLSVKQQFANLLRNDQWLILGVVIMLLMCGYVIRGSVAAYYAKYYLDGGDSLISPFLTVGVVASILAMIATTWVTRFWDKIKMFRYTQLITFALSIAMYFCVGQQNLVLAFIFYFLINFFCDMQMPVFWSSIAETVDYGEKKTGLRVSGLAFGGILFFQKFGMGIAGGVLGFLLSHFGYQADTQQSASSLTGIALMMTLIPAIFHLVIGLVMKKYLINNDYYRDIQSELAERQA
ncbi:MFS transporter [Salmonella enterica]|uniref:MFS transporter n=5 Tax=Salmonella enterica TaxID=28901 RepID=A0A3R0U2A5_SALER|nr:MFS transporter [Salmonella enterica]EAA1980723.1 MFS transporter [Salmonella enterica subsp. enterica serovar Java]ECA3791095.1 MFS transporter [Salmonella enterica subsp. enterica serovar Aqua]ECD7244996.1 MFS transporter [Salmonella enterica subsp. enterica serovar Florida]HBM0103101.1 MFS transporter [Salmonella enterica subsp. enterica serovar Wedding]EAO1479291.1 MFS transporter [Salmonella enterica]